MWRHLLTVAVVLTAGGVAVGQGKKVDPKEEDERAKQQREEKEREKKFQEQWKNHFKDTSELPDLVAASKKGETSFPNVELEKTDTPAVRAAKRAINAEKDRLKLVQTRIVAGQFAGSAQYLQLTDCVFGVYASAALILDDPEKLLPFAEAVVVSLMAAEDFNFPRVNQGLEEPQLLPQLTAARCRAEVTVLKLREQVKAKKK